MLALSRLALTILALTASVFLAGALYWLFTCACKPGDGPFPPPGGDGECPAHPNITDTGETARGRAVCEISSPVLTDLDLTDGDDFIYRLAETVFIGADIDEPAPASVDLTIEPGVTIYGPVNEALVITRGSRIFANGTAARPITMTSVGDVLNLAPRENARAEWAGLVINGRAPINNCVDPSAPTGTAACEAFGEGDYGPYGGADPGDDSGRVAYVRVLFAGEQEEDTSGVGLRAVGSGAEIDFIQVHNSGDDGFEVFGGAVNIRHAIVTGSGDDGIDWTDGWIGGAQFVIVHNSDASDNGVEADNNGDAPNASPRSNPSIANATIIGRAGAASANEGALLRRGTAGRIVNGVIVNVSGAGLDIDDAATFANAAATPGCNLNPANADIGFASVFLANANNFETDGDAPQTQNLVAECANISLAGANTLSGFSFFPASALADAVGVVPGANEAAVAPADPTSLGVFFSAAPYAGAVADAADTWYRGWNYQETPM